MVSRRRAAVATPGAAVVFYRRPACTRKSADDSESR